LIALGLARLRFALALVNGRASIGRHEIGLHFYPAGFSAISPPLVAD